MQCRILPHAPDQMQAGLADSLTDSSWLAESWSGNYKAEAGTACRKTE